MGVKWEIESTLSLVNESILKRFRWESNGRLKELSHIDLAIT